MDIVYTICTKKQNGPSVKISLRGGAAGGRQGGHGLGGVQYNWDPREKHPVPTKIRVGPNALPFIPDWEREWESGFRSRRFGKRNGNGNKERPLAGMETGMGNQRLLGLHPPRR